jgi:hypothetical protein
VSAGQAAAAAASKWQTAAKKAAEESAAKLAEQSQLALKYKQQLQEVQRATAADQQALQERVKELEAMVQQAQEGHEAKARVVQLEADLATAQAALDDVRAEAAEAAAAAEVRPARLDRGRLVETREKREDGRLSGCDTHLLVVLSHKQLVACDQPPRSTWTLVVADVHAVCMDGATTGSVRGRAGGDAVSAGGGGRGEGRGWSSACRGGA